MTGSGADDGLLGDDRLGGILDDGLAAMGRPSRGMTTDSHVTLGASATGSGTTTGSGDDDRVGHDGLGRRGGRGRARWASAKKGCWLLARCGG